MITKYKSWIAGYLLQVSNRKKNKLPYNKREIERVSYFLHSHKQSLGRTQCLLHIKELHIQNLKHRLVHSMETDELVIIL